MGRAESATSATGDRVRDMSESARGTAGSMAATARQVPDTVISQTQGNPMAVGLVASAPACRPPRSSRRASRSSDLPRPRVGSAADIRPARGRGRSGARSVPRPDDAAASNAEREGSSTSRMLRSPPSTRPRTGTGTRWGRGADRLTAAGRAVRRGSRGPGGRPRPTPGRACGRGAHGASGGPRHGRRHGQPAPTGARAPPPGPRRPTGGA